MSTPPKPLILRTGHISNEQKDMIRKNEESLLTGESWKEYPTVKKSRTAHRFFKRLTDLYALIDKNDAMSEPVINRYCLLQAECEDFERKRELFSDNLDALIENTEMDDSEKLRLEAQMQRSILDVDKQIMSKRTMLLNIEKETLMTLKAQIASIPKKEEKKPANKFAVMRNG